MARVLLSISDDFLKSVDKHATQEQRTRSELIREALRMYLRKSAVKNNKQAKSNAKKLDELLG